MKINVFYSACRSLYFLESFHILPVIGSPQPCEVSRTLYVFVPILQKRKQSLTVI